MAAPSQQQQGDDSESDEDAPENRPRNYVAGSVPTLPDSLRQWTLRPANSQIYVPYWTDPAWDPEIAVHQSGLYERPKVSAQAQDDAVAELRPAILPRDAALFPTPYARYDIFLIACVKSDIQQHWKS